MQQLMLTTITAVLLVGCASTSTEKQPRAVSLLRELNDIDSSYVFVAAHRGGRERDWDNHAPENSIANIKKAVRMGFEIYESDLQVTKKRTFRNNA